MIDYLLLIIYNVGGRRTEDGRQTTEDGRQTTEDGGQTTEDGGRRTLSSFEFLVFSVELEGLRFTI